MTTALPGSTALALTDQMVHVERSNLPEKKKSEIRRFYDNVMGKLVLPEETKSTALATAKSAGGLVRAEIAGGLTGLAIAWAEHQAGDMKLAGHKVANLIAPAAAAGGAAFALAAPMLGVEALAEEGQNVSGTALGIAIYKAARSGYQKIDGKATVTGEDAELDALANSLED